MLDFVFELLISALLLIGAFFTLVGSIGLAKLPDLMRRLHAPTKASTLGVGSILIASMLYFLVMREDLSMQELLITVFLVVGAPVTAQMIAKAHILCEKQARAKLPDTGRPVGWATLNPVRAEETAEEANR